MAKVKTKQTISNKPRFIGAIVILAIVIIAVSVGSDKSGKGSGHSTGSVRQSPWDNSVDCVEYYLKHKYLKDPDSYEGIKWTKVQANDNGTYQVTHTFRARNGFGGMAQETMTFTIASDGWTVVNAY